MPGFRPMHISKRYTLLHGQEILVGEKEASRISEQLSSSMSSPQLSPIILQSAGQVSRTLRQYESEYTSKNVYHTAYEAKALKESDVSVFASDLYLEGYDLHDSVTYPAPPEYRFRKALLDLLEGGYTDFGALGAEDKQLLAKVQKLLDSKRELAERSAELNSENYKLLESMNKMTEAMLLNEQRLQGYQRIIEQRLSQ